MAIFNVLFSCSFSCFPMAAAADYAFKSCHGDAFVGFDITLDVIVLCTWRRFELRDEERDFELSALISHPPVDSSVEN